MKKYGLIENAYMIKFGNIHIESIYDVNILI